tara:strand:- start:41 stop:268 length:228 start_codon:yes stop_codon:yes gene_type:complete
MKNLIIKKPKETLINKMCDILGNFYDKHNLKQMCAFESQMSGNYNTDEQLEWLERFSEVWEKADHRDSERRRNAK